MKIIVDAMGGDNAPLEIVKGALLAKEQYGTDIVLVGQVARVLGALEELGHGELPRGIEVADAPEVVTMHDDPAAVIKQKRDSSLVVGLNMLRDGGGDGFVSAGSTGALLSGSTLIVKRIRGIRRAAMAPVIPNRENGVLLIDCGLNAECTTEYLLQFAYMGSFYAQHVMGRTSPRVGLLNIGTEESKGTSLQKETYTLLTDAKEKGKINFIGNVEGREVMLGGVDVVVTDGFTGNVLLKSIEGTAMYLMGELREMFKKSASTKLAAMLVRDGLNGLKAKLDVSEVGGTALLGISKPVIKAHGNSDAPAVRSAIRQAKELAESGIIAEIENNMEYIKLETTEAGGERV